MSEKNEKIEVDKEFLEKFLALAGGQLEEGSELTLDDLKKNLSKIETKIPKSNYSAQELTALTTDDDDDDDVNKQNILVVDDLGIITYQLDVLFKKNNFKPIVSQEMYDAVEKYRKNRIDFVIMDLFIPTEREGFMLLEEIKKFCDLHKKNSTIIVITATTKKEYRKLCLNRGANFFVEKKGSWQSIILDLCLGKIDIKAISGQAKP